MDKEIINLLRSGQISLAVIHAANNGVSKVDRIEDFVPANVCAEFFNLLEQVNVRSND